MGVDLAVLYLSSQRPNGALELARQGLQRIVRHRPRRRASHERGIPATGEVVANARLDLRQREEARAWRTAAGAPQRRRQSDLCLHPF